LRSAIGSLLGKVKSSVRIIPDITAPYRTSSVCGDGIDKPNAATTISVLENKKLMDQNQLKWIADFVWNIADNRLRDVYVRGNSKARHSRVGGNPVAMRPARQIWIPASAGMTMPCMFAL